MTTPSLPVWYPGRSAFPGIAVGSPPPQDDPFYTYTGSTPLDRIAPGTVLNTRRFHYHLFGFPTLIETTQLLYRSTSQTGKPTVNVTSIIKPPFQFDATRVISYQSAYDSLNRNDEPSYAMWGGLKLGRPHHQRRSGGLRPVPRRGVHGDRARHRGSASRFCRGT